MAKLIRMPALMELSDDDRIFSIARKIEELRLEPTEYLYRGLNGSYKTLDRILLTGTDRNRDNWVEMARKRTQLEKINGNELSMEEARHLTNPECIWATPYKFFELAIKSMDVPPEMRTTLDELGILSIYDIHALDRERASLEEIQPNKEDGCDYYRFNRPSHKALKIVIVSPIYER